jgi:hypothetical protein
MSSGASFQDNFPLPQALGDLWSQARCLPAHVRELQPHIFRLDFGSDVGATRAIALTENPALEDWQIAALEDLQTCVFLWLEVRDGGMAWGLPVEWNPSSSKARIALDCLLRNALSSDRGQDFFGLPKFKPSADSAISTSSASSTDSASFDSERDMPAQNSKKSGIPAHKSPSDLSLPQEIQVDSTRPLWRWQGRIWKFFVQSPSPQGWREAQTLARLTQGGAPTPALRALWMWSRAGGWSPLDLDRILGMHPKDLPHWDCLVLEMEDLGPGLNAWEYAQKILGEPQIDSQGDVQTLKDLELSTDALELRERTAPSSQNLGMELWQQASETLQKCHDLGVVHEDLHLGQFLIQDGRWYLLDWEGAPWNPKWVSAWEHPPAWDWGEAPGETLGGPVPPQQKSADFAGLWRSMDYAQRLLGLNWDSSPQHARYLAKLGNLDSEMFLEAIVQRNRYEIAYEEAFRPQMAVIPTAALRDWLTLLQTEGERSPEAILEESPGTTEQDAS